jgi:L-ribulose-5-phosphate 3-epimerase
MISRRSLLMGCGAMAALRHSNGGSGTKDLKISVPDWSIKKAGTVDSVALAASLGFQGVEIALGRPPVDNRLPLDRDELLSQYLEQSRAHHVGLVDVCLDILHRDCLKSSELARQWVVDAIRIAGKLGVRTILMPCAFKCGPVGAEIDHLGDVLKELAPHAEKAGVVFGLEDFLSAEDNVRVMERSKSDAVKVFYDVGNSDEHGFNVIQEIRWLGRERICMVHLKDGQSFLGQGRIDFPGVIRAISDIGYHGYLSLETPVASGPLEDGMRRNLSYIRGLLGG